MGVTKLSAIITFFKVN